MLRFNKIVSILTSIILVGILGWLSSWEWDVTAKSIIVGIIAAGIFLLGYCTYND